MTNHVSQLTPIYLLQVINIRGGSLDTKIFLGNNIQIYVYFIIFFFFNLSIIISSSIFGCE